MRGCYSWSLGYAVRVWDAATGAERRVLQGQKTVLWFLSSSSCTCKRLPGNAFAPNARRGAVTPAFTFRRLRCMGLRRLKCGLEPHTTGSPHCEAPHCRARVARAQVGGPDACLPTMKRGEVLEVGRHTRRELEPIASGGLTPQCRHAAEASMAEGQRNIGRPCMHCGAGSARAVMSAARGSRLS